MPKSRQRRPKPKPRKPQETTSEEEPGEVGADSPPDQETTVPSAASAEAAGTTEAVETANDNDATDAADAADEPENPENAEELQLDTEIVFQCGSCRTVLGDTLADYEAHLESNTLSLRAARNVVVGEKMEMSDSGFDAGCTFKPIKCNHCKTIIGRVYSSTIPALDSRRDTYTFDTTSLISYQLGSCRNMQGEIEGTNKSKVNSTLHAVPSLEKSSGSLQNFETLDLHINTLSDVITQNQETVQEMRGLLDVNTHSLVELRSNQEQAQNMMLLWEERFRRLEECEQRLQKMSSVEHRLTLCEGRVGRLEGPGPAKSVTFSPGGRPGTQQLGQPLSQTPAHQLIPRPPARLKTSPSMARRPIQSPGRTPLRRTVPSPVGTPVAKRRR